MRTIVVLAMACIVMSCSPKITARETSSSSGRKEISSNMEEAILQLVNRHRRTKGLGALQMNPVASSQAYNHSRDMATGKTGFGHEGFEQRVRNIKNALGVDYIAASAENVAYGQLSAEDVVKGWLNSSGHRKNIEGNYNQSGIGIAKDRQGNLFFTQLFFRR